jgi:hypothetical protein
MNFCQINLQYLPICSGGGSGLYADWPTGRVSRIEFWGGLRIGKATVAQDHFPPTDNVMNFCRINLRYLPVCSGGGSGLYIDRQTGKLSQIEFWGGLRRGKATVAQDHFPHTDNVLNFCRINLRYLSGCPGV